MLLIIVALHNLKYKVSLSFGTLLLSVSLVLGRSVVKMLELLFILIFMTQQSHATHGVAYTYAAKGFINIEEVSCNNLPLINIKSITFDQYLTTHATEPLILM